MNSSDIDVDECYTRVVSGVPILKPNPQQGNRYIITNYLFIIQETTPATSGSARARKGEKKVKTRR